jgi:hypothetical protein
MDITQLSGVQYNESDVIRSIIDQCFIVDYGVVTAVNNDKTVNVTHAVMGKLINGVSLPATKSKNIEVLYPASSAFGIDWPINVGDGVLLVGLKDFVKSTNGIQAPTSPPDEFIHYTQEALKAIPLQSIAPHIKIHITSGGDIEIASDGAGKYQIKNSAKSLYTIMNNMQTHLQTFATAMQTFTTGLNTTTLSAQAATMATASATMLANISTDIADLALLLKA